MPKIKLETDIIADINIVFDLSRSIDLHKISTVQSNEEVIAGRRNGLIELNESVTWKAKHFGIYQKLTSKVTELERPAYFVDEQESGIFQYFKHEHHFKRSQRGTVMSDVFIYQSPFGVLGKIADQILIKRYMTNLLKQRNQVIKDYAETDKWKLILQK